MMTLLPRPKPISGTCAASEPRWVGRFCYGGNRKLKKIHITGNRVVAYIRVSDPSQVEGYSLDAQKADIIHWCHRRGYELAAIYVEEGKSARSERIEKRPKIMALLNDARAREFDIVVVHTIDQWSRNVGVQRQALQMLGDAGVGFASVMEDFDFTTPSGKLMLTMIGGVAEFFSDQLAVHVSKAQRYRATIGLPVGSVPFGYLTLEPGECPRYNSMSQRRCEKCLSAGPKVSPPAPSLTGSTTRASRPLMVVSSLPTPSKTRSTAGSIWGR
jgi:DNA invertase Pin-like site-specific DNA recombinase